ncbi:MAG: HAMP domain-containing protein [Clostridia bacterium]|nr:HAMP domain-containing protein [Clostridia bacterium]
MAIISLTRIKAIIHSIRWKITIAYLLIIVTAFCVIGVSLIQLVGEYLFTQRIHDDQRIAEDLSQRFGNHMVDFDVEEIYLAATETAAAENSRILVLDPYCVVQADTQSELNGSRFMTTEVSSVLSGASNDYGFYDAGNMTTYWLRTALTIFSQENAITGVYANAIRDNGDLVGVLVYISTVQDIYESLHDIQTKVILWLIVVTAAVLLVNGFVLRTITRPIGELNESITRMSRGDLSARVNVRGKNEFASLAAAFNSMSERLEQLDKSRNQFVSNASHELKTPLSTMKILIETLMYQDPIDPDMTKEFLTDVNKEIDRLNRIVSDLLTLVNIDSGGMKLNLAEIDIEELLEEQVKRLSPLARENGIELECSSRDSLEVTGDLLKLQQVIYNVIDNAIKYTPRGGEVHCSLTRSGKKAIIKVADTGVGIPQEDLLHIFDRFYRVDKARSRETGGTGLGLSIVKQMVLLHGGNITAASTEGKGSTFTIELPLSAKRSDI